MNLERFVEESCMIEGLSMRPEDLQAHRILLGLPEISLTDIEEFVYLVQPEATLRRYEGMNVRVGNHIAPPGGPHVETELVDILHHLQTCNPWSVHQEYLHLHPFMDGNGRSARAIWLWQMQDQGLKVVNDRFLQTFYYQTLGGYDDEHSA